MITWHDRVFSQPRRVRIVDICLVKMRLTPSMMSHSQLMKSAGDPSRESWIAARFDEASPPPAELLLGDGSRTGDRYINRPLRRTNVYRAFVRAIGRDGVSSGT
jgi:hypothetical protein